MITSKNLLKRIVNIFLQEDCSHFIFVVFFHKTCVYLVSLAIEIYKFQAALIPPIKSDLFVTRENNHNSRNFQELESSHKRTVKFGTKTSSNRGPQIWNLIPEDLGHWKHQINLKKKLRNGRMMRVHVECAKRTFNMLALLTKKL